MYSLDLIRKFNEEHPSKSELINHWEEYIKKHPSLLDLQNFSQSTLDPVDSISVVTSDSIITKSSKSYVHEYARRRRDEKDKLVFECMVKINNGGKECGAKVSAAGSNTANIKVSLYLIRNILEQGTVLKIQAILIKNKQNCNWYQKLSSQASVNLLV